MCGRYALKTSLPEIARMLGAQTDLDDAPRYNVAPTQPVPICRADPEAGARELVRARWGLVPRWAKSPDDAYRMINARAETVAEKPAYRAAFRRRRCLVPADGYYEWQKTAHGKQPWYVHSRDGAPLLLAGLWERWTGSGATALDSCTIVTTDANEATAAIHPRMPAILARADAQRWLDPAASEPDALLALLRPAPSESTAAHPVSRHVNDPRHDDPECVAPLGED